jgi:hypothetical protein
MVGARHGPQLLGCRLSILTAEIVLLLRWSHRLLERLIGGGHLALQAFEPALILGAGLDDHGAVGLPIERYLPLGGFGRGNRAVLGGLGLGQDADLFPAALTDGLLDAPPTFI